MGPFGPGEKAAGRVGKEERLKKQAGGREKKLFQVAGKKSLHSAEQGGGAKSGKKTSHPRRENA